MEMLNYRSIPTPVGNNSPNYKTSVMRNNLIADEDAVVKVLQRYKDSINAADADAGAEIWSMSPEISMIHPRGYEKGWYQIRTNVYGMFRRDFVFRKLTCSGEKVVFHGDIAIIEFTWDFEALLNTDGPAEAVEWGCWEKLSSGSSEKTRIVKSKGRETMILKKSGNEWKIIHIHYSGTPAQ